MKTSFPDELPPLLTLAVPYEAFFTFDLIPAVGMRLIRLLLFDGVDDDTSFSFESILLERLGNVDSKFCTRLPLILALFAKFAMGLVVLDSARRLRANM
jgi:hypothetical protein